MTREKRMKMRHSRQKKRPKDKNDEITLKSAMQVLGVYMISFSSTISWAKRVLQKVISRDKKINHGKLMKQTFRTFIYKIEKLSII